MLTKLLFDFPPFMCCNIYMTDEKSMPKNRRKYRRYPIFATALIKIKNKKDAVPFESMAANISQSGLGIYSYVPVDKGTPVSIEIKFIAIKGFEQKDAIEGKIVHLSKLGKLYYMGIAFDEELNPVAQPFLYNHFWKIASWG